MLRNAKSSTKIKITKKEEISTIENTDKYKKKAFQFECSRMNGKSKKLNETH